MKLRRFQWARLRHLLPKSLVRFSFPGIKGISWHHVLTFYLKKADAEETHIRAGYISFNFLLAMFPAVIFFFTLVAYLPFEKAHINILQLISNLVPDATYKVLQTTLNDILKKQRGGLLSFGFLAAIYFSTSAVDSMIRSFHRSMGVIDKRKLYKRKAYSILLNLYLSLLLVVSLVLITGGSAFFKWLKVKGVIGSAALIFFFNILNWAVVVALILAMISSIYTFGPYRKKHRWKFVSPGSIMATILIVLMSTLISAYVNNFNAYNKIYGSIGTLIVIMLWIYWNCVVTLIGFDLNVLIDQRLQKTVSHAPQPDAPIVNELKDNILKK